MVDQSEFGENKNFKRFSGKTLVAVWRESGTLLFAVGVIRLVDVKLVTEMEEEAG